MFSKRCGGILKSIFTRSYSLDSKRYLQQTHYEVLGLSRNCSNKEIKEAFIKLSKRYHPDKNTRKSSHNHFVRVLEAYSVLNKPESRRNYDWELTHGTARYPEGFQEPPRYYRRRGYSEGYGYDDPSFWANRDKSRDRYYQNASYYGVPGIRRVSNGTIALICIVFTIVGITLQFFAIRHSVTLRREVLQKQSMDNENILAKIQSDAARNGRELQIELLEQRFQNNKYYRQPQHNSKE